MKKIKIKSLKSKMIIHNDNEYNLNIDISPHDDRDWNATLCMVPMQRIGQIPDTLDYRNHLGPARDQGSEGACFHGDTKIKLYDGTVKTIKELSYYPDPFLVYSRNKEGELVAGVATAHLTRKKAHVMTVELNKKYKIICTPDHKFLLKDRRVYMEALYLKIGDKLSTVHFNGKNIFTKMFDCICELLNVNNLEVTSLGKVDEITSVYCLNVDTHHNFALDNGVVVHNCLSFAVTAIKEVQENIDCGYKSYFSPQFIYDQRGNTSAGMYPRTGMNILYNIGVVRESLYPYGTHHNINDEMKKEALNFKIKHYARVNSVIDAKMALFQNGPLLLAVPVFGSSTMSRMWVPNGKMVGGHAMCIVGYTKDSFIVRNSWGTNWNDNGYCYFPFNDWPYAWEVWSTTDADSPNVPPEILLGSVNFRGEKILR